MSGVVVVDCVGLSVAAVVGARLAWWRWCWCAVGECDRAAFGGWASDRTCCRRVDATAKALDLGDERLDGGRVGCGGGH